jgi:hypothetical protein
MKPSEFLEIKEKFEKEQVYWESLYPGMIVFEEFGRFFDMEYFKHEIISVNIDERILKTKDHSQKGKIVELKSFYTIEELKKKGIFLDLNYVNIK